MISWFVFLPFLLILLCIALLPLVVPSRWEHHRNKLRVVVVLMVPVVIYLVMSGQSSHLVDTLMFDYLPFIVLLGGLFIITGGISLEGDIQARPLINSLFLIIGAILASFIGTTGAAMLLVRALIQTNTQRKFKTHTLLFFIAIVANCGGLLTPLGDPPLFMMYLRGAPFTRFFQLIDVRAVVNILLIIIYFFVDRWFYHRECFGDIKRDRSAVRPLHLRGATNFFWLLGVILAIAFLNEHHIPLLHDYPWLSFVREVVIAVMAWCSLRFTASSVRLSNNFNYGAIQEVAYLFLGIFVTMIPCILFLQSHAESLGIASAHQFYYYTGLLSSFLDNTPTALVFHSLALGMHQLTGSLVAGIPEFLLRAISLGAVLFGAMTYIGNGPNLMIKSIAQENGITMPSFFGYMIKFSLIVLLPVFIIVQLLFIG